MFIAKSLNVNDEERFLKYLTEASIVLSYWNPIRGELMPITYTVNDLLDNYKQGKPPLSGKVKAAK